MKNNEIDRDAEEDGALRPVEQDMAALRKAGVK